MRFEFKRFINLMIFVLVMIYMSFMQRVYALPATPDVREYEFPNLLINEVSFKNSQHDFIEIVVDEYISNASKSLKGLQIIDDNMFFEIEDDILVESEDKIIISFKEDSESIEKVDEILQIKLTKSGLTGTTEQVILKNHNNIIVDGVCWASDSPTQDEITDFEELYEDEQWIGSNISSCINSENINAGISIGRKNKIDTNSANDWEIVLEEVVEENIEENEEGGEIVNIVENEILNETNSGEILEKTTDSPSEKITSPQIEDICEGGILISEIMPNPSGKDTGKEWIELINTNNENCNLYGWQIDDQDGGSKPYLIYDLNIKGGGGFLLLPSWETKLNLNNGEDEVRLFDSNEKIVSEVTYESAGDGQSFAIINEDEYEWSRMPTPLLPNEFPEEEIATQPKESKTTSKDDDDEKSNNKNIENGTLSDKIYITELFPNPEGSDSGNEWIEIHNGSGEKVNLGNWRIDTGGDSKKIFIFENKLINPGEYITLGDKDLGFALKNSENEIRLLDFENSEIDTVSYNKVVENASFMKITIESEKGNKDQDEEITWKWIKNTSPGEKNQKLYKYIGNVEDFDEINSILNLQVENADTNTLVFHVIQSGDNILSHIFKEDIALQIIASKENEKLTMETYEILEQTQNPQDEEEQKSENESSLYTVLSFLPPLGFMGYFGIKKWGLIKII